MKTRFLFSLLLIPSLAFPAVDEFSNLRLRGEATGYGSNSFTGLNVVAGKSGSFTNGSLTLQTNSQMTAGGGTNDNRGVATLLVGSVTKTNGFNIVSGSGNIVGLVAGGTAAGGVTTNNIAGTGSGNVIMAENISSHALTNVFSWESSGGGNLVTYALQTAIGGNGHPRTAVTGTTRGSHIGIYSSQGSGASGSNQLASINGSIALVRNSGSGLTNVINGSEANILVMGGSGASSNYYANSSGGLISAQVATGGGYNELTAARGGISSAFSTGVGSNVFAGGGLFVARNGGGIIRQASGVSGAVVGQVADGQTITHSAGDMAAIVSLANSTYGSAAVSASGATLIGGGYTNAFPYRFMAGYGSGPMGAGPAFTVSTNNAVGVATNDPQATLDVNGSAQSHFGFLSGISNVTVALDQDVFAPITNYQHQTLYGFTATPASGEDGALTNAVAGYYGVDFSISLEATAATHIHAAVFTNGTECTLIEAEWAFTASGTVRPMSATGIIYLPAGTRTDLRLLNTESAADPVISRVQLRLGHP